MSQHTPGPWHLGKNYSVYAADKSFVCDVDLPLTPDEPRIKANGELIAAAPDMLTALLSAQDWIGRMPQTRKTWAALQDIKAAIVKAQGGTP